MFGHLGDLLQDQGRWEEAKVPYRRALELFRKARGGVSAPVAGALSRLGSILHKQGRDTEAEPYQREALEIDRKANSLGVPRSLNNLANVLRGTGKAHEAEGMLREALDMKRRSGFPEDSPDMDAHFISLARALEAQDKLEEAEVNWRRCLEIRRKSYRDRPELIVQILDLLARNLTTQGKREEADSVRREILEDLRKTAASLSREDRPNDADFLGWRADVFARLGQWPEAINDLRRACELRPFQDLFWQSLTAALVQHGDIEAYRDLCRTCLDRFGTTKEALTAARIAKDCLVLPSSGVDYEIVGKMIQVAASADLDVSSSAWLQTAKGLAEYRVGHFASAVDYAQQALGKPDLQRFRDVQAKMVLAMAQHQLKRFGESRTALSEGERIDKTELSNPESGDLGTGWPDRVFAQALLREATELIEGKK